MLSFGTVRSILIDRAQRGLSISYSELFQEAGVRFSRPKVRALCRLLGEIDEEGAACGEPPLAVLVVRGSDRLPGEGWWETRTRYSGPREGEEGAKYVRKLQRVTFRYWKGVDCGGTTEYTEGEASKITTRGVSEG